MREEEKADAAARSHHVKRGPKSAKGDNPSPSGAQLQKRAKQLSSAEKRELDGLFERIEESEERAEALERKLSDPETYKRAGDAVGEMQRDFDAVREEVTTLTARWEELEARKQEG